MHADELEIDGELVGRLLAEQFPEWADRPLVRVVPAGTDNAIFRLDGGLAVRLARRKGRTEAGGKQREWLPRLAPLLPLEIPVPVAQGKPTAEYPWYWDVFTSVEGETVPAEQIDAVHAARDLAAFVAGLLFDLSPLAVYYQRQVLLDNIMVFWLLLCIYLLVMRRNRVLSTAVAGLSLGLALVTKENAIFLLPGLGYLVYRSVHGRFNRRFAASFWAFAAFVPVGVYVMYAVLKNELWPTAWNFSLSSPPTDHVSLMYTVWWQLNRSQQGLFSNMLNNTWMPRDGVLLIIGALAVLLNLYLGWRRRQENPALFAIALLAAGYAFYLIRGSVVLEFYVLPIIPLLAMNIGIAAAHLTRPLNNPFKVATVATCAILLFSPIGGYFLVYNDKGQVAVHDLYSLSHTDLQQDQVAFLRQNVPYNARIIMDDDIWTFLHEERPFYPFAHSHWKAASDPAVRDTLFQRDWRNIDYIVMSNKMRAAMQGNNAGNQEGWIIDAADNHSQLIWQASRGDVHLMIYQINKQGASGQ